MTQTAPEPPIPPNSPESNSGLTKTPLLDSESAKGQSSSVTEARRRSHDGTGKDRRRSSARRTSSVGGAQQSPDLAALRAAGAGGKGTGLFGQLRRKAAPFCRKLNRSKQFQLVMFIALLCALFLPDIWVLVDMPHNDDLDICLTIVLCFFIVELIVQSIGLTRTYWGSFFFYMDLIGAFSLLLDLTYFTRAINLDLAGNGGGKEVGNNVVIMRAARMAKLGARAGRFTKLVKLLRFLPGMREQGTDQGTAKVISAQLMTALSTRVSCLIIVMVMVMPTFSMVTYPEQDWSMKSWMQILERMSIRHPEQLADQLAAFEKFYLNMNYFPYALNVTFPNGEVMKWTSSRGTPRRPGNVAVFYGNNETVVALFNFSGPNQVDSGMNALLMTVIIILMVCFSLVLSNSVSAIVLRPLEKLLQQVRKMASTIFKSVTDMAQTMREENEEQDDDEVEDEMEAENGPSAFGTETQLLEKVVQKLAILSEITMTKSVLDAETMEQLGEGDRAVIHGFQGSGGRPIVGETVEEEEQGTDENVLMAQRLALENAGLSSELLDSWDLNPLELDKARNHAAMTFFLGPHNHAVATYDPVTVSQFLQASELGYLKTCPYHNWFHAVDVTHGVYRMLNINVAEAYLNGHERYALLISAVCHDIGHPGLNNPFLVETSHELALLYNDKSPLENMHCAKLFEIASKPNTAIFAGMAKPLYQETRKVCVEAILHTDMTHHFSMVKDIQMMYEVSSEILDVSREFYHEDPDEFPTKEAVECFRQQDNKVLMRNLILHASDVSNPFKPFRICRIWAWQVLEEFFHQGDREKELGIQVQMLNDRDKVNRAFSQIGFIEFLVTPLIFAMVKILPPMEHCAEQMIENVKQWKTQWINDTKPQPTQDEQKAVTDRIVKLENKYKES